jgi:ankyrin repeat protein
MYSIPPDVDLAWAISAGNLNHLEELLSGDASLVQKALVLACQDGNIEIATYLIKKGADVDKKDSTGKSPLFVAAENGHTGIVLLLIEKGADIIFRDPDGKTPFYIATQRGHIDVMSLLLEKGADATSRAKNHYNFTPLNCATYENNFTTTKWLVETAHVPIRSLDQFQETAMFSACFHGNYEIVRYLIEKGDDPNYVGEKGILPRQYANQYAKEPGRTWTMEYLTAAMEGKGADYEPQPVNGVEFVPTVEGILRYHVHHACTPKFTF